MTDRPIIAIADDEAITRDMLAQAFEDHFEVRTFDSGQAALEHLASNAVCMLLLDVDMPGLTGYETCRALRARSDLADLPVIFLSAHSSLEERLLGYAAGGSDYVTKPFDIDELNAKITVAIDVHSRARQLAMESESLSEVASITAEMVGEAGVVLDFQRTITGCTEVTVIADTAFDTLGRFGLDGCMRLRTRGGAITRARSGTVSALENSLLDHLESRPDARIVTMGPSLGFSFGDVTLLVRSITWALSSSAPETLDAMGRARDNVALIVEGMLSRLKALEAESDARHLVVAQRLIATTREALQDLDAASRQTRVELDAAFEAARDDFEYLFPQLGLTPQQEERLVDIIERQRVRGQGVVARGRLAEQRLSQLLDDLKGSSSSELGS